MVARATLNMLQLLQVIHPLLIELLQLLLQVENHVIDPLLTLVSPFLSLDLIELLLQTLDPLHQVLYDLVFILHALLQDEFLLSLLAQ